MTGPRDVVPSPAVLKSRRHVVEANHEVRAVVLRAVAVVRQADERARDRGDGIIPEKPGIGWPSYGGVTPLSAS